MASILIRSLGPGGDPLWGQGQQNFIADLPALAQLIKTRLLLFLGEWFANTLDGTPYWQSILGTALNKQLINRLLVARILATPFVNSVTNVQSSFDPASANFSFSVTVLTKFGTLSVTNQPKSPSQALPQ
jgi:hypothetical protein